VCTPQPPITVDHHVQADGSGVSVAVVDSGIDGTHPFFQLPDGTSKVVRNMKLACYGNLSACPEDQGLGANPWIDVTSIHNDTDGASMGGHGTHVAGIVGGVPLVTNEGKHIHGAAPGAKLIGLSIGQSDTIYGGAAGLEWVLENHAAPCGAGVDPKVCPPIRVVNNSWGPVPVGESQTAYDPNGVVEQETDALVKAGVVVVWAAGNGDAQNNGGDGSTDLVTPYAKDPTPGVLGVADYDDGDTGSRDGGVESSSSRGLASDPATYPDIAAPGTHILSSCRRYLPVCEEGGDTDPNDIDFMNLSGTSMATPHIAGIVAQLFQLDPQATPAEIENAIEDTAHQLASDGPYVADTRNKTATSTTSFSAGHGLVDVVAAASQLLGYTGPAAAAQCTPDGPVVTDASGDAVDVIGTPTPLPSNDQLDILDGHASWDPNADGGTMTFTIHVKDLQDSDPQGTVGMWFDDNFTYAGTAYDLVAQRSVSQGTTSFELDTSGTTGRSLAVGGLDGSFDSANDLITIEVPNAKLGGTTGVKPFADGVLSNFQIVSRRNEGELIPDADTANGVCPYTIGLGAVPPVSPPPPPPPPPPPSGTNAAFFLHATGGCASNETYWMDLTNSNGDDDGCGPLGVDGVTGAQTNVYPATVATGVDLPAGSTVKGTIYIATDLPSSLQASVTLKDGAATVGAGTSDSTVSTGGETLVSGWTALPFTFTTTAPIASADKLEFDFGVSTATTYYFGYEGDHASQFVIHHD
jgi:serine protease AprX